MVELLEGAARGFADLGVEARFREAALVNLERWLRNEETAEYRPMILALVEGGRWELLLDSFYQVIPFGTGGRRGPVGVGPNRINPYTVASSVQGHAAWLRERFDGELSVVVAYDVRCFQDARELYPAGVPSPVLGLSSRDFAELAARVYAANGVRAWILPPGSPRFISTPELSFSIRHLGAQGGLNISASHNPPDDNGAKVYDHHGGQEVPPNDEHLVDRVKAVREVRELPWDEAVDQGLIRWLEPEVHQAYLAANLACGRDPSAREAHVVFTPLHGTGDGTVAELLTAAGFRVDLEPGQSTHDGAFPLVPFGIPNPEVPESMDRAVALATELGADLVMACDPDADRLGMVVRHGAGWRFLNGNEMGALLVRSLARPGGLVVKTEVTSSLITRLARSLGSDTVDHLLVGFKYIAELLRELESRGELERFTCGIEESHGLLVTPAMRDKDAAGAALLLAEAASLQKRQGRTLVDLLEQCWEEVGYVSNVLLSTVMRGATGRSRIEAIQESFRRDPPTRVGERAVTAFHDRRDPEGVFGPIRSETDAGSRDVLVFELGPDARVILRPSGTEPKNKIYAELAGRGQAAVDAACRALAEDFALEMLRRVDLDMPRWALRISGLVAVEHKRDFALRLLPALLARLDAGEADAAWLDAELRPYGKDARQLVAPGVRAFLEEAPDPRLAALFEQ